MTNRYIIDDECVHEDSAHRPHAPGDTVILNNNHYYIQSIKLDDTTQCVILKGLPNE